MGMDLIPRNKNRDPWHMNLTGWAILRRLIHATNANVTLSEFNDGDFLPDEHCKVISQCIATNMDVLIGIEIAYTKTPEEPGDRIYWMDTSTFFKECNGCEQW